MSADPVLNLVRDLPSASQKAVPGSPTGGARSAPVSVAKAPRTAPGTKPGIDLSKGFGKARDMAFTLASGTHVFHVQAPSVIATWQHHRAAARRLDAGVLRWPRYAYGAAQTTLVILFRVIEWVTHTVPGFAAAVTLVLIVVHWR